MPAALDRLQEVIEHLRVPGDPVVPVVPSQLQSKRPMLLAHRRVAMCAAPPTNAGDRPTQAIRGCLPLDHPEPAPRPRPIMGEAQQIERLPSRDGRRVTRPSSPRLAEVDQSGLFRVQGQIVPAESLRQHGQHPTRILFLAKAQHRIVRVADQDRLALEPRLDVLLEPHVQYVVQEDVRQQG